MPTCRALGDRSDCVVLKVLRRTAASAGCCGTIPGRAAAASISSKGGGSPSGAASKGIVIPCTPGSVYVTAACSWRKCFVGQVQSITEGGPPLWQSLPAASAQLLPPPVPVLGQLQQKFYSGSAMASVRRALRVLFSATPRILAATRPCLSITSVVGTACGGTYWLMASSTVPDLSSTLG